jgi:hypothetical protein
MKKINKNSNAIKIIMPTDEEDRQITLAALSDPDCPPMTDEDFEHMEKHAVFGAPWTKPGYGQTKKTN